MRKWLRTFAAGLALATAAASSAGAGGNICFQLWAERNAIYKAHGYCFHSWRAQSYFGNFGCAYAYDFEVPLSPGASARIDHLVHLEFANGCRWSGDWG